MDPSWLTATAALLGPLTGAVTGAWTARRGVRAARTAADQQSLSALHAGYQALLAERATYTRDVLAELAAVKAELSALRAEHLTVLRELAGLRAHFAPHTQPPPTPATPDIPKEPT
ncbi:hypothetical protein [Actinokineospora iranica]|uniref:Uncharacterized protein n=1 Tax=Actinokineospora iranica TaxID=1271860 RepID=A0A1G6K5R1_9PSEU|nr:hypothetical protein [Actinokineospora iranica]SDC25945.1 hypothetical protein SAMN05216174_101714 [Actinokineospora iranica]